MKDQIAGYDVTAKISMGDVSLLATFTDRVPEAKLQSGSQTSKKEVRRDNM